MRDVLAPLAVAARAERDVASRRAPCRRRLARSSRADVEDFLYAEAALLDEWRLDEWLALFTEDATYSVPSTDAPDADPSDTLFLIADDDASLRSRVEQLMGKTTWSENPHARTRRLLGNVRIRRDRRRADLGDRELRGLPYAHNQTAAVRRTLRVRARAAARRACASSIAARSSTSNPCATWARSASSSDRSMLR